MDSLEKRIVQVGNASVKIGEQLEEIDEQRACAFEIKTLLQQLHLYNQDDESLIPSLAKDDSIFIDVCDE